MDHPLAFSLLKGNYNIKWIQGGKRITYVPARETSKCINLATICRSVGPGLNCNLWHTKKCIALINSYFWTHSVEIPDILQQLPLLASNFILNTNPIKWRGAVCLHVKIVTIGLSTWIQHTSFSEVS